MVKRALIALAMKWGAEYRKGGSTDVVRLNKMMELGMFEVIHTVSVNPHDDPQGRHHDLKFGTARGTLQLAALIADLRKEGYEEITITLDYFGLESQYYKNGYGIDWLTHAAVDKRGKVHESTERGIAATLFAAADQRSIAIILPNTGGSGNGAGGHHEMRLMMDRYKSSADSFMINVDCIAKEENPLWLASNDPSLEQYFIKSGRGGNESQTRQYTHPDCPFIKITPNIEADKVPHKDSPAQAERKKPTRKGKQEGERTKCTGKFKNGAPCTRYALEGSTKCATHQ